MTETRDLSMFVKRDAEGIAHMELAVEGVGCAGCIRKIENGLKQLPGVTDARLNFTNRRLAVDWRDKALNAAEVIDALDRIGYRAHPFEATRAESDEARQARWLMRCLAVAGFAAMNIMLLSVSVWSGGIDMTQETRDFFHWLSALIALAGWRLCGTAVLPQRLERAARRPRQHGRADFARRHPGARHVGDRNHQPRPSCLFRFGDHAAVLPAVRPLRSITRCVARRARSPATWPRSRPRWRTASRRTARS